MPGDGEFDGGGFTDVGDLDGDGSPDAFMGGHVVDTVGLTGADGGDCRDAATTSWSSPDDRRAVAAATGDFDGDGLTDLVVSTFGVDGDQGQLEVYRGPLPPGTFHAGDADVVLAVSSDQVAVADVDADGRDDLVAGVATRDRAGAVFLWRGRDLIPAR